MKKRNVICFVFVALFLMASCIPVNSKATKEIVETYRVSEKTVLTLKNINGDVDITEWDKPGMEIRITMETRGGEEEFEKVDIKINPEEDFSVETIYLKKKTRVSVNFEIKVPSAVAINEIETINGIIKVYGSKGDMFLTSTNGDISVSNVNGRISCETVNGNIDALENKGIVLLSTTNGNIKTALYSVYSDGIKIDTTNGSINIAIKDGLSGNLQAETVHGNVDVIDLNIKEVESTKIFYRGKLSNGGPDIKIETVNGNISIGKI